jgi:hypothetical protein
VELRPPTSGTAISTIYPHEEEEEIISIKKDPLDQGANNFSFSLSWKALLTPSLESTNLNNGWTTYSSGFAKTNDPKTMKTNRSAILAICLALVAGAGVQCASGNDAQEASILYKQGLSALKEGDANLARQSFLEVLRKQPRHVNARIQLDRLRGRSGELAATRRKQKLASIKIVKVDYEEVTLQEALEALSLMIDKQTEGKFAANFVIQDPGGHLDHRPVSLQLSNVPAHVVLKHLLTLADARERYDEYAIVVKPMNTGTAVKKAPVEELK